eukprot:241251-Hanusia_phi.AAC.1
MPLREKLSAWPVMIFLAESSARWMARSKRATCAVTSGITDRNFRGRERILIRWHHIPHCQGQDTAARCPGPVRSAVRA